jgi:hypothetical protein
LQDFIRKILGRSTLFFHVDRLAGRVPIRRLVSIHCPATDSAHAQMKKLLLLMEAGGYGNLRPLFEELGFEVVIETSARRGMGRLKNWQPDVLVADFYKRYFHDRVSNLESLLAAASRNPATRIIILYDPFHSTDLELLRRRHRIDAALALPLSAAALQQALSATT